MLGTSSCSFLSFSLILILRSCTTNKSRNASEEESHGYVVVHVLCLRINDRRYTHPLGDAPGMRGAPALGTHFERHLVLLQLHVPVHARHLQRRVSHGAAELQEPYHGHNATILPSDLLNQILVYFQLPEGRRRRGWQ
jgi:hypothetical protein